MTWIGTSTMSGTEHMHTEMNARIPNTNEVTNSVLVGPDERVKHQAHMAIALVAGVSVGLAIGGDVGDEIESSSSSPPSSCNGAEWWCVAG